MLEKIIELLLAEMQKVQHSALMSPADKSEFGYGNVSGQFQGLMRAKQIVEHVLDGKEEDDDI